MGKLEQNTKFWLFLHLVYRMGRESNFLLTYIVQELEGEGEYEQKLREKFSNSFLGQFFSVDFETRRYTGKFWVKHLFLGQNVTSLAQFLPKFQSQKIWKPCIPIDRSSYPEQKILLQQLLKINILQVTGDFVFQVTRGSKLV